MRLFARLAFSARRVLSAPGWVPVAEIDCGNAATGVRSLRLKEAVWHIDPFPIYCDAPQYTAPRTSFAHLLLPNNLPVMVRIESPNQPGLVTDDQDLTPSWQFS